MTGDYEEIRDQLRSISERLAELAIGALRNAIATGEQKSAEERRITRARRAVENAASILSGLDTD